MSRARTFADLATASETETLANRNLIINGAMDVIQRGTQTTIQTGFTLDRWFILSNSDARLTVSKDTNVPTGQGFLGSLKIDVTTADTSVAASHITSLLYQWEGQDLQQLRKGTSSAKKLTLQFWVSSPKTGIHTLHFYDLSNARIVAATYTIDVADTWQYVKVTFPADTTGALANDNTEELRLYFGLNAGSNYTSGTLQTTWASNNNANRMVGQVNTLDDAANNFYITGVQMELGEVATPFEFEKHADTLAKCQRYMFSLNGDNGDYWGVPFSVYTSTSGEGTIRFPQAMRAKPSVTMSGTWNVKANDDSADTTTAPTIYATDDFLGANLYSNAISSATVGQAGSFRWKADSSYIHFSAEL